MFRKICYTRSGSKIPERKSIKNLYKKPNPYNWRKNMRIFYLLLNLVFISSSFAQAAGMQNYGKETVSKIRGDGLVKLNGTTVTETIIVNGNLTAKDATIEDLEVNGLAKLTNCKVNGSSKINGVILANNTKFNNITTSCERVIFNGCSINSIHVLEISGYKGSQTIELRNKTKVEDGITFDSGKGIIIKDSNSSPGDLVGGSVKK